MSDLDPEQLREALTSAKQIEAALRERLREQDLVLSGIEALQGEDDPAVLQQRAFDLLSRSLLFHLALVLEPDGEDFVCTAATDPAAVGARWRGGGFFNRVAHSGRAAVTPDNRRVPEWKDCQGLSPLPGGGIYAPILAATGPGLLVLCSHTPGAYGAKDGALVSRLSLVVSQTLAAAQRRRLSEAARAADIARQAAVEASEAKSRFLANMSHEIRTPLNGVTAVADLLAMTALAPRQHEMAQLIAQSGRMLERLLNDVLDFAKIEAGYLEIEREPFQLDEAVSAMIDLFAARADAKGLAFTSKISPGAKGLFEGDSLRVRQILANLLSNAVKFTEAGEVRLEVMADDEDDATQVTLRVSDTGCGFTPERGARLFNRFEQGDDSITRQYGGTGLGLTISRSLAALMGGTITWRSTPGQGSTFEATVRVRRLQGTEALVEKTPAPDQEVGLRVLVVEDNPNNRRIVGMVLELIEAEVTFAENGQEGLDAFAPGRFDIILMDLQMPVLDGLSATREIRARERVSQAPPVPIIALSANAMTHHVAEALAAGATAHVAKPIVPERLIQTMIGLAPGDQEPPALSMAI